MKNQNRTSASLFSGAGFGDMGFESAGFEHLLLCEIDPKRTNFTSMNFPEARVLTTDIAENIGNIVSEVKFQLKKKKLDELFLLYATPPCQGMSKNGIGTILKAMDESKRPKIDKRNHLYLPVIEVVKETLPKWIFFENVCRLFNFKDVDKEGNIRLIPEIIEFEFRSLGYVGRFEKTQMADYGLPQTRLRTVGIFRLKEGLPFAEDCSFIPAKLIENPKNRMTLRDVIWGSEKLVANSNVNRISKKHHLHRVPKWRNELNFWMKHTPEGCSAFDNNICISCNTENAKHDIYCQECNNLLPKPTITKGGRTKLIKGFVSAYKRMYWDKPASTITTRSAYACSDHKVHPSEDRVLSILEIAKLQGIDVEDVCWTDSSGKQFSDTLLRELIGESVPPLFTKIVGEHIEKIESNIFNKRIDEVLKLITAEALQLEMRLQSVG